MNKRVKKKWLEALRGDEYVQGQAKLLVTRYEDTAHAEELKEHQFCCLGVLCQLHAEETGKGWFDNDNVYHPSPGAVLTSNVALPQMVKEWAGLQNDDPIIEGRFFGMPECVTTLGDLNDGGKSFKQIANVIEKNL